MDENDNEGEMLSVLGENDSSDDPSKDESVDHLNCMKSKGAIVHRELHEQSTFHDPRVQCCTYTSFNKRHSNYTCSEAQTITSK